MSTNLKENNIGIKKVLIVDDEKDIRDILKNGLEQYGIYDVRATYSGFVAGILLRKSRPHVIVLDIKLGDIDGRKMCEIIRQDSELSEIKLIGISGKISEQEEKSILKEGFDAYLGKPFDIDDLHKTIMKL